MQNTTTQDRSDTGLLMLVAGIVASGAIGLALLAGWSAEQSAADTARAGERERSPGIARNVTPPPTKRPAPVAPVAMTASLESSPGPAYSGGAATEDRAFGSPGSGEPKVPGTTSAPDEISSPTGSAPRAFAIDPDVDPFEAGSRAFHGKRYAEAVAYLEAATTDHPERAYPHYLLGLARWKSGDLGGASEAMTASIDRNPRSVRSFVNLARIENERGEFETALEFADAALGVEPDSSAALFLRARSLRNLGRNDEAIVDLERSLEVDSDNGYARNLLGLIFIEHGDSSRAVDELRRAARLEPGVAYVQNNLGMALELDGRTADAGEAYARAVEIDPQHTRAALNLARIEPAIESIVTTAVRLAEAVEPADPPAVENEPTVVADAGRSN